jgi:hypothetical protein
MILLAVLDTLRTQPGRSSSGLWTRPAVPARSLPQCFTASLTCIDVTSATAPGPLVLPGAVLLAKLVGPGGSGPIHRHCPWPPSAAGVGVARPGGRDPWRAGTLHSLSVMACAVGRTLSSSAGLRQALPTSHWSWAVCWAARWRVGLPACIAIIIMLVC